MWIRKNFVEYINKPDENRGLWSRRRMYNVRSATSACTSSSAVSVLGIVCASVACYSAAVFCSPFLKMTQTMSWKRWPCGRKNPTHNPQPQPREAFDSSLETLYGRFQDWAGKFFRNFCKHQIETNFVAFSVEISRRNSATEFLSQTPL